MVGGFLQLTFVTRNNSEKLGWFGPLLKRIEPPTSFTFILLGTPTRLYLLLYAAFVFSIFGSSWYNQIMVYSNN